MRATLAVTLTAALLGCQPTSQTRGQMGAGTAEAETEAARTAFDLLKVSYSRWIAAGQADSIAGAYTPDGQQLPPNEAPVVGRDAIRARQATQASWGKWTLAIEGNEVAASGPLAIERGTIVTTFTPGPDAPPGMKAFTDTAKYLVHFRNVDGQWLVADAAWSSNLPLPKTN